MGKTGFQFSPDGGTTKYDLRDSNIAPIELDSAHASQPYAVNEEFVLDADGNLYTATSPISQGSAIVVYPTSGYNCKLSDSITEQIATKADKSSLGTASTKNSTSVVTDSSDLVESGAVYDAIKGNGTLLRDTIGWSGKQLMPPSINNISTYLSGRNLTGQNNLDGTLTIDGTCSGNSEIVWFPRWLATKNLYLPIGKYVYNINRDDINLYIGTTYNGSYKAISGSSLGSVEFEITSDTQSDYKLADGSVLCAVYINILNGTVLNNEVLYPMIRKADIVDPSYEPYHASVEEYCASKEDIVNTVGWIQRNLVFETIPNANVNADGGIRTSTYSLAVAKVKANKVYTISPQATVFVYAFFTSEPTINSVSYNNSREVVNKDTAQAETFTAPIDGYIVVRFAGESSIKTIQVEEGSTATPIHKSIEETKTDNSVIAPVENSSTASQDYAVGDYFIKDTILGKTKAAIASGGTFTKDTNYEETNVAKELTELYKYIGILTTPVEAFTANSLPILKRNITNAFYNGSLRGEIAAGNFKNVRPGDYIIGQATGSTYYVAECDYWLGNGDSTNGTTYPAYNTHHLGLMLFKPVGTTALWSGYGYSDKSWRVSASDLGRCPWNAATDVDPTDTEVIGSNSTNITRSYNGTNMSAYMGSFIRERIDAILLPQCFQADFGSENVLKRRNWLSNAINASAASGARSDWQGIASGSVWVDRFIDLASEVELYGSRINSSSRDDIGVQNKQLPIYRNGRIHDFYPRMDLWTKGVAGATFAAGRNYDGVAVANYASFALWACPLGCVK